MNRYVSLLLLVGCVCSLHGQSDSIERKSASFFKIPDTAEMRIDGEGLESWWSQAALIEGFTQQQPETAQPASMPTRVKVLYDNSAIYILAEMKEVAADSVLKELSIRDELFGANTDIFGIYIDAYQGGNSSLGFFVSPVNVQADIFYTPTNEDASWDVVWQSNTRIHDEGWTAEMRIPYAALRFPRSEVQRWNVNFLRRIRRKRETAHWNFVNPNIDGFINQFGFTEPLKNIEPPLRLSVTPYIAGVSQKFPTTDWDNNLRGGMDVKWGIDESFTLDMTLIPDFSQVRTDNQVLNLTPFEIQFQENRPFFTEGIDLFDRGDIFYSRRIGGATLNGGKADELAAQDRYELVNNPPIEQLLNASKFSGRNNSGLGIGVLNAFVNRTEAVLTDVQTEEEVRVLTQPLTNYNISVLDQILPNNSNVALINTNVWRSGRAYDANVTALESRLRDRRQNYQLKLRGVLSQKYSPDKTDLGHRANIEFGKISGRWRWNGSYSEMSDTYDPNDLGFLLAPNDRSINLSGSYNVNRPFGDFVRANSSLTSSYQRLYAPDEFSNWTLNWSTFFLGKNFYGYNLTFDLQPIEGRDFFESRTADFSRYVPLPANGSIGGLISTNYGAPFAIDIRSDYKFWNAERRSDFNFSLEPRFRFSDRFSLYGNAQFTQLRGDQGWVQQRSGTVDGVLIGTRDQIIISNEMRTKYTFTNRINLNLRVRHYWSQVEYKQFDLLDENSRLQSTEYPQAYELSKTEHDINFNTFNIDATLTWRFAPGSDLILAWTGQVIASDDRFQTSYLRQIPTLFEQSGQTTFSLKLLYFLNYPMVKGWSKRGEI